MMPQQEDPMEAIKRLGERLKDVTEPIGLDLLQFLPLVDFEHEGHRIQAVFVFNPPVAQATEEQAAFDEQFKELEKQFASEEENEKVSETADKMRALRDRMKGGKSLLGDEGDDGPVDA